MYTMIETGADFETLDLTCKKLAGQLLSEVPCLARDKQFALWPFGAGDPKLGNIYLIKEGSLTYKRDGHAIFHFNEGDIVGLGYFSEARGVDLVSEENLAADVYDRTVFYETVRSKPEVEELLSRYQGACCARLISLVPLAVCMEPDLSRVRQRLVRAGEEIIKEGEDGDDVYLLREGAAEVFSGGIKLCDLEPGAYFGELTALAGERRSATVVAKEDSLLLEMPKKEFLALLPFRPVTAQKLVQDLAKKVRELTKRATVESREP